MDIVVSSGVTSSGVIVHSGDTLTVEAGGVSISAVISSGGVELLSGTDSFSIVSLGGVQSVTGLAVDPVIMGGVETVLSGGVASGALLEGVTTSGVVHFASQTVSAGGTASNSFLYSAAFQETAGVTVSTLLRGGSVQYVASGGLDASAIISASSQAVLSGGVARSASVMLGGSQEIRSGGVTSNSTISSGAAQTVDAGGRASGTDIYGSQLVSALGSATGGHLLVSGLVTDEGLVSGLVVSTQWAPGGLHVLSGGVAEGIAMSAGIEIVSAGGLDSGSVIGGGGPPVTTLSSNFILSSGAIGENEVVVGGGLAAISGGATVSNMTIASNGVVYVLSNATVSGMAVQGGGLAVLTTSAALGGITVSSGGEAAFYQQIVVTSGQALSLGSGSWAYRGISGAAGSILEVGSVEVRSGATLELAPNILVEGVTVDYGGTVNGLTLQSGQQIQITAPAQVSNLSPEVGADIIVNDMAYGTASFDSATHTLLISSGSTVVSVGVAANIQYLSYTVSSLYGVATEVVITSESAPPEAFVSSGAVTSVLVVDNAEASTVFAAGHIGFAAPDPTDVHSVSVMSSLGDLGSLSAWIAQDTTGGGIGMVDWCYAVPQSALAILGSGQTSSDIFTLVLSDSAGDVIDQNVTVTVEPGGYVTSTAWSDGGLVQDYTAAGALIGAMATTSSGGQVVTQFTNSAGGAYAGRIVTDLGGGFTELQDFNGAWAQQDAQIVEVEGGGASIVQLFDSAWTMSAAINTQVSGAVTEVQDFNGSWVQTGATIATVQSGGAFDVIQHFDSAWSQTSASIVQSSGGTVQSQYFDSAWVQTGAVLVQHPSANVTETQVFGPSWNQLSADIATVSGSSTIDQQFNSAWTLTGGTITTEIGPNLEQIGTYDSSWSLISTTEAAFAYGAASPLVFTDTGTPTTYVLSAGQVQGDAFVGFVTAAADPAAHDVLEFVGYGAGAAVSQVDASHWDVTAPGLATEVFTLSGALSVTGGDVKFT